MLDPAVLQAREYFPRGLSQPENGFRFSIDALLLAAFAARYVSAKERLALDLGTGCGVVGLSLLLRISFLRVMGADVNAEMLAHAVVNARNLGLADKFDVVHLDVRKPSLGPECVDVVLCNPPYRDPGRGRVCPDSAKTLARFESGAGLVDFVRSAAFVVKNRKACFFIQLAERIDDMLQLCREFRLRPKDLLFIHPKIQGQGRLVLLRAVKNGGAGLVVHPPLILHDDHGLSEQMLAFCPEAGCNA